MSTQGNDNKSSYKNIEYSYSVYGENNVYGGGAWIHLHFGDVSQDVNLVLFRNFETLEAAEAAIIKSVQCWIDDKLQNS